MVHSFDIEEAQLFGLYEAIILNHFRFWIAKNKANNKHFYEGKTWTYNSINAYEELFPYFSKKQIRTTIESLIEKSIIVKGNFNINTYNRTLWYAFYNDDFINKRGKSFFPEEKIHLPKRENGTDQQGKCITVDNTVSKPDDLVSSKKKKLEVPPIYVEALDLHFKFYAYHNKRKPKMDGGVGDNLKRLLLFLKNATEEKTWDGALNLFRAILYNWTKLGEFYKGKEDVNFIYSQIDRILNELRKKTGGSGEGGTTFDDLVNNYM